MIREADRLHPTNCEEQHHVSDTPGANPPAGIDGAATERPLTILIGADTFAPDVNGAARFAERLAAGLVERGHDVHIMAPAASRKHGTWKEWTADGVLLLEQSWKRGKLDGSVKKYVDGKLSVQSTYAEGKAEGPYVELRNGKPAITGQFASDRRTGTWTTYASDDSVVLVATYKDGVLDGPWRQLVGGFVLEGNMAAGRRAGAWTRTDKAGAVRTLTYGPP